MLSVTSVRELLLRSFTFPHHTDPNYQVFRMLFIGIKVAFSRRVEFSIPSTG